VQVGEDEDFHERVCARASAVQAATTAE
jgi:hypothetical protein